MFKAKIIMTTVAAACALGSLAAATASASWFINGAELKTTAALSPTEIIDQISTILAPGLGLAVQCSGATGDGIKPEIIAGNTAKVETLKFLVCNVIRPASGCSLEEENESISTAPLIAQASLGPGESDRVRYSAQTGSTITSVRFNEANTCAFNSEEPVKGSINLNAPLGQLEGEAGELEGLGSIENNSLEIGAGNKLFIDGGNALIRLTNHSKWSFK